MNDGENHVEEENLHARVGDVKIKPKGGYTRRENANMGETCPGELGV